MFEEKGQSFTESLVLIFKVELVTTSRALQRLFDGLA